ncbi:histidine phosphatase family protein [Streptomyces fuscigenes]|uniref:histidine phosphatase family protein n=1 Tax=Streptomyces fuscigenes TaxID=1528880 RepID=UPI001F414573|nr:phosphoglycerate mutase family protein [Streptomyces fuscigenes]MCF3962249.1 histidine phosphatase family protein [Streptomyces fuscigenes]
MSDRSQAGSGERLQRLTVVRHGQSTANVFWARAIEAEDSEMVGEGIDADVALSRLGTEQARALGCWLVELPEGERPGLVVCSTYLRARQTWEAMARVVAGAGADVSHAVLDERLRDREMGVFELLPPPALRARAPEEAARRDRLGEWFYRPPGGESLADVALRVRDFLTELRAADDTPAHVLLVAHDSVVLSVRHVLAGIGDPVPEETPVPNASVSSWQRAPGAASPLRLVEFGSTGHLTAS